MRVKVRNGNVDKALSIFKRKTSDIVYEVRQRQFYEKPADSRRKAMQVAKIRERKRKQADRPKRGS